MDDAVSLTEAPATGAHDHDHGDGPPDRVYDTVALDEMDYDEDEGMYFFQCPCGDLFEISEEDIAKGVDIARCPSCSLRLRVKLPESKPT